MPEQVTTIKEEERSEIASAPEQQESTGEDNKPEVGVFSNHPLD